MSKDPQIIRSVQRAINVLKCFREKETELSHTDIVNETGLAKSTTTRLLATLEQANFVEKVESTGRYRLGRELYFLGHVAGRSMEIKEVAKEPMIRLREQLKETVNLYVREGKNRVCIHQYESVHSIKHVIQIGQVLPLTVGASGKVLLAYEPRSFIEKVMKEQTMIKSENDLLDELHRITLEQYAISIEERETGTSAASAPIFDIQGDVVAALSVSGPASRFNPKKVPNLKTIVVAAALEISNELGYLP